MADKKEDKKTAAAGKKAEGKESFKISNKSHVPTPGSFEKKWVVIDAADQPMGRIASQAAGILQGKTKPYYSPSVDCGDNVIIINAGSAKITGNKMAQKLYRDYSGYPGGLRERTMTEVVASDPTEPMRRAVKGMLPKNRRGNKLYSNLRVFAGGEHTLGAQKPELVK